MTTDFVRLVTQVITINHAWKLSKDEFGVDFVATKSLRDIKSSLQATLLRDFPQHVYLAIASDNHEHQEALFSVRLREPLVVNGALRNDIEHLPERIANTLFTQQELQQLLARASA
ncbi:hypothetical protein K0504_04575 [Neiella marina]|uniref:Uncharacterized protein n=1 Tax=Neiella holothuriorum TaxID=2870530 RepID=A0ABS7EDK9_9GAMM|nr:hypothetical protein [Neiella holothuriorum]MBW8190304.1 hypothetical protein [Neiella holothuriorum]